MDMLKLINNLNETNEHPGEGDLGIIIHDGIEHIVFFFKENSSSPLRMVSLTSPKFFWENGESYPITRVLQKGERLIIT
jgi:hypothetical protein